MSHLTSPVMGSNGTVTENTKQEKEYTQEESCSRATVPQSAIQPSSSAAGTEQSANKYAELRIPTKNWTRAHYDLLGRLVSKGARGEDIMQLCGISRRKDFQALVQIASQQLDTYLKICWNMEYLPGEGQRALPPLKVGDDGSFRISKTRLARLGVSFPEGTKLRVQKGEGNYLIVQMVGNRTK